MVFLHLHVLVAGNKNRVVPLFSNCFKLSCHEKHSNSSLVFRRNEFVQSDIVTFCYDIFNVEHEKIPLV